MRGVGLLLAVSVSLAEEAFDRYRLRAAGRPRPDDAFDATAAAAWVVAEVRFYADVNCSEPLVPLGLLSSLGEVFKAFDGDVNSTWEARCRAGVDSSRECEDSWELGPFLGFSLASPAALGCAELWGEAASGVTLEGWSGQGQGGSWQTLQRFGDVAPGSLQLRIPPDAACNFEVASAQGPEGMRLLPNCAGQAQWRLRAPLGVTTWSVYELQFFSDDLCTYPVRGLTFAQPRASVDRSEDGDLATAWSLATAAQSAWIGMAFDEPVPVQCVRIAQFFESQGSTAQDLEVWNGTMWIVNRTLTVPPPEIGQFQHLPPPSLPGGSQWRLVNTDVVPIAWAVHELSFHSDALCQQRLAAQSWLSADAPDRAALELPKAFDGNPRTAWVSSCSPCPPGAAYLGLRFEAPVLVRCLTLRHAEDADYRPTALDLQRWDEGGWRTVATFNAVLGGLLQLSPSWGQPQTRFVVGNSQSTISGWKLAELRFFRDEACLTRIRGVPFAVDGDSADADGALDGNLDSLWFANCCSMHGDFLMTGCSGCQAGEAWVGVLLPQNDTVKCIQLLQRGERLASGALRFASGGVSLRQWAGFSFQTVDTWDDVPLDAWAELGVGRAVAELGAARGCQDIPDWEKCNDTDWNCSTYALGDFCNATFQDEADCEGTSMALACKASCCLCGADNPESCGTGAEVSDELPEWVIPVAASGGGLLLLCCVAVCCLCRRRRAATAK